MDYQNQIVREDMCELAKEHLPFEKLKGSSVLVTGASGMLATYMVYFFMYLNETRKYDINVTALVRNEKKAWEKFEDFRDMPYFHLKVQDVCTPITMEEKPEYIIHAAGNASPHFILHDPVGIIAANTTGTVNVLELARKSGTKKSAVHFHTGGIRKNAGWNRRNPRGDIWKSGPDGIPGLLSRK